MPWQEVSIMSLRKEFVLLASREGVNLRALCRQFGISAKTGYKLLKRYQGEGEAGLEDRSRRPRPCLSRLAGRLAADRSRRGLGCFFLPAPDCLPQPS